MQLRQSSKSCTIQIAKEIMLRRIIVKVTLGKTLLLTDQDLGVSWETKTATEDAKW